MRNIFFSESINAAKQFLIAILAWVFGYPMTFFFRRDPNLIVVIGRKGSVFSDNSKYFFIYATQKFAAEKANQKKRVVFFTTDNVIHSAIINAGGQATLHPTFRSLYLLLKCGTLVTDMMDWFDFGAYQLSRGTKIVQIWHGAPLKKIELDLFNKRLDSSSILFKNLLRIQKTLVGRYPVYDVVVATSQQFINNAFNRCFKANHFLASGYPRNDVLLGWPYSQPVFNTLQKINVDNQAMNSVAEAKLSGKLVCLYVPTFRQDMVDPFSSCLDIIRLSEFAKNKNIIIVLKLHPFMQGRYSLSHYPNLLEYSALGDIYPLMAQCDILITDYSSIFFDFLLLDRPIVFFAHDLESYLTQDRGMYFPYESMTPGEKCSSQDELEKKLNDIVNDNGDDGYAKMREEIRDYTHDFKDNQSSSRLLKAVFSPNV